MFTPGDGVIGRRPVDGKVRIAVGPKLNRHAPGWKLAGGSHRIIRRAHCAQAIPDRPARLIGADGADEPDCVTRRAR